MLLLLSLRILQLFVRLATVAADAIAYSATATVAADVVADGCITVHNVRVVNTNKSVYHLAPQQCRL